MPPTALGLELDPVLMERALYNILENAANYTPPGTQVTIAVSQAGGSAKIEIRDEGLGIPPQALPRLFEKFYRGGIGEWKPGGTGLGLAISRGLLHAMGGSITVSNRQDRSGAKFTITFPLAPWSMPEGKPSESMAD
jgi:two-component system sensor histidine kinase KdpD